MTVKSTILIISFMFSLQIHVSIIETNLSHNGNEYTQPVFYKEGILFAQTSKTSFRPEMYYADIIDRNTFGEPVKIGLPKKYDKHIAPGSYLEKTGYLYFTTNNVRNKNGVHKLAVCKGKITDFALTNVEILHFCSPKNSYAYPTLSSDGLTMILATDKYGDMSLVKYTRRDLYSKWKFDRLIDELNTEGHEYFPNLANDSLLFYSVSRRTYPNTNQLYISKRKTNGTWEHPHLFLGGDIETYGIASKDGVTGYMSIQKTDGEGGIYYFKKP